MKKYLWSILRSIQADILKHLNCKLFFALCLQVLLGLHQAYAATYYVSPSGSDSNNGTAQSTSFKTINNALGKAQTSGDIVYVMTGTYAEVLYIGQSGITLSAYPGNKPVIDGGNTLPGNNKVLLYVAGNNNTVSGFEVKNSNISGAYSLGFGVLVFGTHNLISKMNVHHAWSHGIFISGDYNTVEDSTIWQAALQNSGTPMSGGWGTGLSAANNQNSSSLIPHVTSYAILRRNIVFNNWGEGLSCWQADHCTLEDNIVYDNWTNNLYLSDATNSLVQRNMVYVSSNPAISFKNGTHQRGLTLGDEVATVPRSANNTIINNFIFNTDFNAFSWTTVANSGLNNVLIANNTIVDGGLFTGAGGSPTVVNTNSQIRNNIILGKSSNVPSNSGITFSNNNWAATPSPAASSTDVTGDPQIARTGTTTPGTLTGAYFKISSSSPVINKALSLSAVTVDFFRMSRGGSPDIGGHEFSSSSPTPTPTPAPVPASTPTPTPTPAPISSTSPNLALNRPVTVSSTYPSNARGSYYASYAVDGNSTSRWSSAFSDPQWIAIDLGSRKLINRVVLNWEVAYGKSYSIQVSDDNATWTNIYSTTTGDGGVDDLSGLSGVGRYIRMYGTTRGTQYGYSLYEMSVYGTDAPLSLNRPVTVSSTQPSDTRGSYYGSYAVDGKSTSRWSSTFADPQWITIDLGSSKQISRVVLNWEVAYGKSYKIQVSNDNVTWTTIYSTTTGDGGLDDLSGLSGTGRYVRMYGTARGTIYGYSLYEMSVYGQ